MKITDSTIASHLARLRRLQQEQQASEARAHERERLREEERVQANREDTVTISSTEAQQSSRVERIRAEVEAGTYRPDPAAIADRLLGEEPEF